MTNTIIRSRWLRSLYARELWAARIMKSAWTQDEWKAFRFGLESGF